jgi:hypothetical protein
MILNVLFGPGGAPPPLTPQLVGLPDGQSVGQTDGRTDRRSDGRTVQSGCWKHGAFAAELQNSGT